MMGDIIERGLAKRLNEIDEIKAWLRAESAKRQLLQRRRAAAIALAKNKDRIKEWLRHKYAQLSELKSRSKNS